jgi:hypothetical protein
MTINIDVYCKRQPIVTDLATRLNWEPATPLEGYETYRWVPEVGGNRILIALKKRPEILSGTYDRGCIDENVELARFAGVDVPEELINKFQRDNLRSTQGICTAVVETAGSSIREPLTARPSCPKDEAYTIRADEELYRFATQFPLLEGVDPWFKLPFGLVKFTRGAPTYEVGLETTVSVSEGTLRYMTRLAGHFAKKFDGIVYDVDNDKFGIPDAEKLHKEGMEAFMVFAKQVKAQGFRLKPADF